MVDAIGSKNYIAYLPKATESSRRQLIENDSIGSIGIFTAGTREEKVVFISDVLPGQPAERAGLQPGDAIISVNGDTDVESSLSKIHGPVGQPVKIGVWRSGCTKSLTIIRKEINFSSVERRRVRDIPYIKIRTFSSKETGRKIRSAIQEYKADKYLILDLRDNQGGFLDQASESLGALLGKSLIYSTIDDVNGAKNFYSPDSKVRFRGKLLVLINKTTVSSGEIVAGALKESGRAQLFGERTYGKGYTNALYPLSNGGLLAFARTKWLTPNGQFIEGQGILPNISISDTRYSRPTENAILHSKCTPGSEDRKSQKDHILDAAVGFAHQASSFH